MRLRLSLTCREKHLHYFRAEGFAMSAPPTAAWDGRKGSFTPRELALYGERNGKTEGKTQLASPF